MLDEVLDKVFQVEQARASVNKCYVVYSERGLQLSHLVQLVQYYAGIGVAFHIDDDAHTFAVGFVVGVGDAVYFLFVGQVGYRFDEFGFVYSVRNFGYNDFIVSRAGFYLSFGTHNYASASG